MQTPLVTLVLLALAIAAAIWVGRLLARLALLALLALGIALVASLPWTLHGQLPPWAAPLMTRLAGWIAPLIEQARQALEALLSR
jgi:uncharacterized SAM-binding protein YcdF (DUF218 family)